MDNNFYAYAEYSDNGGCPFETIVEALDSLSGCYLRHKANQLFDKLQSPTDPEAIMAILKEDEVNSFLVASCLVTAKKGDGRIDDCCVEWAMRKVEMVPFEFYCGLPTHSYILNKVVHTLYLGHALSRY
jgi:hypothetical protein